MDRMTEFLDNFTNILIATKQDHAWINTFTCKCGYEAQNPNDKDHHVADAQARKLIEYLWEK